MKTTIVVRPGPKPNISAFTMGEGEHTSIHVCDHEYVDDVGFMFDGLEEAEDFANSIVLSLAKAKDKDLKEREK